MPLCNAVKMLLVYCDFVVRVSPLKYRGVVIPEMGDTFRYCNTVDFVRVNYCTRNQVTTIPGNRHTCPSSLLPSSKPPLLRRPCKFFADTSLPLSVLFNSARSFSSTFSARTPSSSRTVLARTFADSPRRSSLDPWRSDLRASKALHHRGKK